MGSSPYADASASTKEFEDDLVDTGTKTLNGPSSTEELVALLERAECLLSKVRQEPPKSMAEALLPMMKAFKLDEIFHHGSSNVQVSVAFCLSELTRITAPDPPYDDDTMKEIFQLFVTVFKKIPSQSDCSYHKILKILDTMAKVKSCMLLLDIGSDALIVEMIQLFLSTIRSGQPSHVVENMETIMNMLILEADEIPFEIPRQLLAAVKLENKNISPVSWELGEKVIRNCSAKLRWSLKEAVTLLDLDLKDYAEVVASICEDKSSRKNKVEGTVGPSSDDISRSSGLPVELSPLEPEDGQEIKNEIMQEETGTGAVKRKRGRKPNSLMTPDEGYDHPWIRKGKGASETIDDGKNSEKKTNRSSRRRVWPKKRESVSNYDSEWELLEMSERSTHEVEHQSGEAAKRRSVALKGKSSRRSHVKSSYGEELLGSGIKVWWPLDKVFYEGTVMSFDPETKKHKIKYYDDEEEILNLSKEKWELLDREQPEQKKAEIPSPATLLGKSETKEVKRRGSSSRKQERSALPSERKRIQWSFKYRESSKLDADNKGDLSAEPNQVVISSDEDSERTMSR